MFNINVELPSQYEDIDVATVGGYPRDVYMGRERNDVDLVVTGVTPEDMRSRGFKHIMSSNEREPVFLDSLDREVAIARTEQSTGRGHNEFNMDIVDPDLPHEEAIRRDLKRRDLTMNAIAVDIRTEEVFDPSNGTQDIDDGVIRHVSTSFTEDPLRVVRAARYAARFGFEIADETMSLMDEISGDVAELSRGRVGGELIKSMRQAEDPRKFFDVLREANALDDSYPEFMALDDVPAGPDHTEGSAYEHTMRVINAMFEIRGNDVESLLAALAHDIGKSKTPEHVLPEHDGHEDRGGEIASNLRSELEIIRDLRGVMSVSAKVHGNLARLDEVSCETVLEIAELVGSSPLTASQVADLAVSNGLGREPQEEVNGEMIERTIDQAITVIDEIGGSEALESRGLTPDDIGEEIEPEQVGKIVQQDREKELSSRIR